MKLPPAAFRWKIFAAIGLTVAVSLLVVAASEGGSWVLGGLVFLVGVLVIAIFARSEMTAAASIDAVIAGARHIASGNLDHRVIAAATEDTRALASAFNSMADVIQRMVEQLSQDRGRVVALVETMGNGVLLVDASGTLELINNSAREMLAIKESPDGPGRLHDADLLTLAKVARERGERQQQDVDIVPGPRYVSAIATPLADDRVLMTIHDLTSLRRLNVTRREFVSNVSHELRNPLAAITTLVDALENGAASDPERAPDFLGRVRAEVERMTALVNDLLTLSRIESSGDGDEASRTDVGSVIEASRFAFEDRVPESVQLTVVVSGVPTAAANPFRLRQVIDNLIDNALRFTSSGQVTVSAKADDGEVELSVSDTGEGISPEHLPHIFERFYKADASRSDPGTGLGLSIVRHIVESAGGSISVESNPGIGTTFTVRLPSAGSST